MSVQNCAAIVMAVNGTLLDTKALKRGGWKNVFADRQPSDQMILDKWVLAKPGDRFVILREAFKELGVPADQIEAEVKLYAEVYDEATKYIGPELLFAGVSDALATLKRAKPLFVSSLTPDDRLNVVLLHCNLAEYFTGVYGSMTPTKKEQIASIADRLAVDAGQILVVSDRQSDVDEATALGCMIVGVADADNGWVNGAQPFPVIAGVRDLPALLGL